MAHPCVRTIAFAMLVMIEPAFAFEGPRATAESSRHRSEFDQARMRMQVQAEQRRREIKREFDRRQREFETSQRSGAPLSRPTRQTAAPPFDPAAAPSPEECFKKLVLTARNASSMEPLLPLLQRSERQVIEMMQAQYDPRSVAERRAALRKLNPNITADGLNHLTASPFENKLKWYKGMAEDVIEILNVKIEGNKAHVEVCIRARATVDGEEYAFGTATATLVGEDNFWRLDAYKEGILVYKERPR